MSNYKDKPLIYTKEEQMNFLKQNSSQKDNQVLISTAFDTHAYQISQNHSNFLSSSQTNNIHTNNT